MVSSIFICFHSFYYTLPFTVTRCKFFVTRCYSLSLVVLLIVTRCHSLCHSFVLVVTRCTTCFHLLSFDLPLTCLFINDRSIDVNLVFLMYPANISRSGQRCFNVETTLIRRWKWNKTRRPIFNVAQRWNNVSARRWNNVETMLIQRCFNLASTLIKGILNPMWWLWICK